MLASNKKRYGVSFFRSFLLDSFSLFVSAPYLEARIPKCLQTHVTSARVRIGLRHIMSNQLTCKHPALL